MKRKVKRYDEGGVLTDRYGNTVKSGSGEDVKTRYGSSTPKEDRPTSSDVEDYASMGKRAPAKSTWSGETEIKEEKNEKKDDYEPDSVAGKGAENLAFESDKDEESKPVKKKAKKKVSKYEDTGAKIGSQDFKMKPSVPEKIEDKKRYGQGLTPYEKGKSLSDYAKMLGGDKKETNKSKDSDEKLSATRGRAAGMFQKTNEGVYGMKKGGKVSSASFRGDGIAQRGKTRGKMC